MAPSIQYDIHLTYTDVTSYVYLLLFQLHITGTGTATATGTSTGMPY
jgi:hypothetical protein